jgi:hypothetical protein
VLATAITFETDVPTVEEMADRIVDARVMHEWLVLEVDGEVTGYAYAHQFNRVLPTSGRSRRASTSRRTGCAPAVAECSTPNCCAGSPNAVFAERSPASLNPTMPATRCITRSAFGPPDTIGTSDGN